jgi:hypothetical protein
MIIRCLTTVFLVLLAVSAALPQEKRAVPPPPKPTDEGPSLEATMKFIQDKLNDIGPVNHAISVHNNAAGNDWTNQFKGKVTKVVADPSACRISYHWKLERDGAVVSDFDAGYSFKDVGDIVVTPLEQYLKKMDTAAGHPQFNYSVDPPVFALQVRRTDTKRSDDLFISDEQLANRLAKTMVHAVELCGGAALAQETVPPPPKPVDDGPSLEVTMKFVQQKLTDLGKVSWVQVEHNSKDGSEKQLSIGHELSSVAADAAACRISLHRTVFNDGKASGDYDMIFPLKTVENLMVMTKEQHSNRWFARFGTPEITASVTPSISVLVIHVSNDDWRADRFLAFFDEDTANRVAKATLHAVELCGGGGKPEPF